MYYDMLIRIKNAQATPKRSLKVPYSKLNMSIAELLVSHGYIASATKKGRGAKRVIDITLKEEPAIHGIRLVSTPSRSIYAGYREIRPVKGGHGMAVLTTSYGILTGEMARKQKVGGKVLFEIW